MSLLYAGSGLIPMSVICGGVLSMMTSTLSLTLSVPSVVFAVQVTVSPGESVVVDKSRVGPVPRACEPLFQV